MSLVSVIEMAYLAKNVYEPAVPLPGIMRGWYSPKEVNVSYSFSSYFFGRLYIKKIHERASVAVLAYRGTMPVKHPTNDLSDFMIAVLHKLPISYKSALGFLHKARKYALVNYPNISIKLTGHSLGGALAQLVAVKASQVAVVFNSPGIGDLPTVDSNKDYSSFIHNINSKGDLIAKIGKVLGDIHYVDIHETAKHIMKDVNNMSLGSYYDILHPAKEIEKVLFMQHEIEEIIEALQHNKILASKMY